MQQVFKWIFLFSPLLSGAQTNTVAYSRDYEFKEGIFLTLNNFKNNQPILKSQINSSIPTSEIDFISQIVEQKTIIYKDSAGFEQKLQTNTTWGYAQNRTISINFNNEFHRLNVIGNLSLFSAIVVQSPTRTEPIGDMYAIEPTFQSVQQYVFDTKTNKVFDFTSKNMEILLKDDVELYTQFMKLKKRKKADEIFIYLRKYNERHPLYLSKN